MLRCFRAILHAALPLPKDLEQCTGRRYSFSTVVYFQPLFFGYTLGDESNSRALVQDELYLMGSILLLCLAGFGEIVNQVRAATGGQAFRRP
jgi:hypothetical protein